MFCKTLFRIIRIYSTLQHISNKTLKRPIAILVGSKKRQGLLSVIISAWRFVRYKRLFFSSWGFQWVRLPTSCDLVENRYFITHQEAADTCRFDMLCCDIVLQPFGCLGYGSVLPSSTTTTTTAKTVISRSYFPSPYVMRHISKGYKYPNSCNKFFSDYLLTISCNTFSAIEINGFRIYYYFFMFPVWRKYVHLCYIAIWLLLHHAMPSKSNFYPGAQNGLMGNGHQFSTGILKRKGSGDVGLDNAKNDL
jgi:hypothetical protein